MQLDIKSLECGKGTRKMELGRIFYVFDNPSKSMLIQDRIICPKCRRDISGEKCMIKINELLISLVTANLCMAEGKVPEHLKGRVSLTEEGIRFDKEQVRSKSKISGEVLKKRVK